MSLYWCSVASLGLALMVLLIGGRLFSPAGLLMASLIPTLLGFGFYADRSALQGAAGIVLLFPPLFALGSLGRRRPAAAHAPASGAVDTADRGWLVALWLFVTPLVFVHFAVLGIAALSEGAEVERFSLNSGFGGVPSRVVLFVVPVLTLAASVRASAVPRGALVLLWTLFLGSRMAMGFKSGLLEVLIMIIVVMMLRGVLLRLRSSILIGSALCGALFYANWVGSKYATISSNAISVEYLLDRLGRQTAEPALMGLAFASSESSPSFFLHDLAYFVYSYTGLGQGYLFPIDKMVSAALTGSSLTQSEFIVPVTLGGPTYLIGTLGGALTVLSILASLLAFFLVGRAWRHLTLVLESGAEVSRTRCIVVAGGLLGLRSFVVNGGGAYVLINYAAAVALAVLLLKICERLAGRGARGGRSPHVLVAAA